MNNEIQPNSRQNDIILQEFVDELLIYDLLVDKAYCLNKTSMLIWQLCDGTNSVSEIADSLSKHMKSDVSNELVWLAIDQLKKDNLLDDNEIVTPAFDEMSRREVIRKVGLASAIALPIVSSMIVPSAIQAASCLEPQNPCIVGTPPLCCDFCQSISGLPGEPGICTEGG